MNGGTHMECEHLGSGSDFASLVAFSPHSASSPNRHTRELLSAVQMTWKNKILQSTINNILSPVLIIIFLIISVCETILPLAAEFVLYSTNRNLDNYCCNLSLPFYHLRKYIEYV